MSWEFGSHEVRHKVCCKIFISLICFCCFNCWQHFMWSHIFSNPKFLLICELGIWKTRGQTRGLLGFGQLASLPLQKYNVAPRKTHDETHDVRTVFKMLIFSMYPNFARGNTLILRNTLCYETQEDVQFWPSRSLRVIFNPRTEISYQEGELSVTNLICWSHFHFRSADHIFRSGEYDQLILWSYAPAEHIFHSGENDQLIFSDYMH